MTDNARIDITQGRSNWFIVGGSTGIGSLEMSGNSVVSTRSGEFAVGTDTGSVGSLLLTGNSKVYASNYLTAGNFSGNLSVAGLTAYSMAPWVGLAVAAVMLIVIASYRQNVHAYPSGGGDYEVVYTNLEPAAGMTGASGLLVAERARRRGHRDAHRLSCAEG